MEMNQWAAVSACTASVQRPFKPAHRANSVSVHLENAQYARLQVQPWVQPGGDKRMDHLFLLWNGKEWPDLG